MTNFQGLLRELRSRIEPLEIDASETWWNANITSDLAVEDAASEAQKQLTRVYADRTIFALLRAVDVEALSPDDARQHRLLLNAFTANQIEESAIVELVDLERKVEAAFNQFRPLLRGEPAPDNQLREILRASTDTSLRRDAWLAGKEVGAHVVADVLRLVALRNREARGLGFQDFYRMSLTLQEIDADELFALLDDIATQTDDGYATYKRELDQTLAGRFETQVELLAPWHYGDPFFQEAPSGDVDLNRFFVNSDLEAITRRFYDDVGLDVRDILARSDLYGRDGKSQHAFCVHIGRFEDIRILCNCVPSAEWMGTMLHECGHAVYDKYLDRDLPFFLREPAHTLTTEAIAMYFGRLSRDAGWLTRYVSVPPDEATAVAEAANREQSAQLLIFTRWCLVMAHFERALYANPEQDLNTLWWSLVEKYQGLRLPDDGRESSPDWAAKVHVAVSPVYYHNYLLGEMLASQLWDYTKALSSVRNAGTRWPGIEVGKYMREEIFGRGARLPWNRLIEAATGEPLNPAHFVTHIGSPP